MQDMAELAKCARERCCPESCPLGRDECFQTTSDGEIADFDEIEMGPTFSCKIFYKTLVL